MLQLYVSSPDPRANQPKQCNVVISHIFSNCSREDLNGKNITKDVCVDETICRRVFRTSRIKKQTFSFTMLYAINDMMRTCCGNCAKLSSLNNFTFMSEISQSSINSSDFIYPILGNRYNQNEMYGYHFIPSFDLPTAYYCTLPKSKLEMIQNITKACINLGPLLILCMLGAMISGFVVWTMETWGNPGEFPRPFHVGIFEGFWWSFISMTTVGYGDKTPKSIFGRLFAMFWILIGITVCSLFTAALTSEIIKAHSLSHDHDMTGQKVGCLNYRANDAIMISERGGIVYTIEYNDYCRYWRVDRVVT